MKRLGTVLVLGALIPLGAQAQTASAPGEERGICVSNTEVTVSVAGRGPVEMWRSEGALGFTSHMHVNADGAPNAYRPDNRGLSYICDGAVAYDGTQCVDPGDADDWQQQCNASFAAALEQDWAGPARMCIFGFEAEGGEVISGRLVGAKPLLQGAEDPIPGNYVSATALTIPGAPEGSQRRYADSSLIPFIVLPAGSLKKGRAKLGDVAAVYSWATNKLVFATVADAGPSWGLGEGSIALHKAVGNDPLIERGGVDRAKRGIATDVTYLIFSNEQVEPKLDPLEWIADIDTKGAELLEAWGGLGKLKACGFETHD